MLQLILAISFQTQLSEIELEELKAEVEELKIQKAKLKAELTKENQKLSAKVSMNHGALNPHFQSPLFSVQGSREFIDSQVSHRLLILVHFCSRFRTDLPDIMYGSQNISFQPLHLLHATFQ